MSDPSKMKIALIFSGCGRKDGTEIHEAMAAMLSIYQNGAIPVCISIDQDQDHVIDHLAHSQNDETRNMLVESARLARNEIYDINSVEAQNVDAVIFPGGYGTCTNLSSYIADKENATILPDVKKYIRLLHANRKPIGAICGAIILVGLAFRDQLSLELSFGNNHEFANHFATWGMKPKECSYDEIVIDEQNRIVTTPAYIFDKNLAEVFVGIDKLVKQVVHLVSINK